MWLVLLWPASLCCLSLSPILPKKGGNTLTLTVGSDSQDCTLSGNSFTMEEDGSKVVFTKK